MNFNVEELNYEVAYKASEFVKGRLLQSKESLENSGVEFISSEEALAELDSIRREYREHSNISPIENTKVYKDLCAKCQGTIDFSESEIEEIASLIQKSIQITGIRRNDVDWDIISFAIKKLDALARCKLNKLGMVAEKDEDYTKAIKWKRCLNLTRVPLYYKPYACIIESGFPYSALRIATDENKTLYDISNAGVIRVDELEEDTITSIITDMCSEENSNELPIEVAVNWWAQALTDSTFVFRYDETAGFMTMALAQVTNMKRGIPSEETMDSLKSALKDEIREAIKETGRCKINVGFKLDPVISSAAARAQFNNLDYAWETTMDITNDEVSVTFGKDGTNKQMLFSNGKAIGTQPVQKVKR